jgi:pyridoxamine 5'-phosphate oxidase
MARFHCLLLEAGAAGEPEPTAMTLATHDAQGRISARTVLLKDADHDGFVFYTNTLSLKGQQLGQQPQAALLFLWKHLRLQVQVRVEGAVQPVSEAEADGYFATRPRLSQIGAWASQQSSTLDQRSTLEQRVAQLEARYADQSIPRPPHWSGYRVKPEMIELWFGMPYRLHDRECYELGASGWTKRLLYP